MSQVDEPERSTQSRIVKLFQDRLHYEYLGNWEHGLANSNIDEDLLLKFFVKQGHTNRTLFNRTLEQLQYNFGQSLYENNKRIYSLLRYGVKIKLEAGKNTETVWLINWDEPLKNDFAIAEEVSVRGYREKRPDIVLYVNGLALGILELKRSSISIGEGIRQSIVNQRPEFIQTFFSTIQFVFAGNNTEGLRYGTIGTQEKFFLKWKEDEHENDLYKLDKYLLKICEKERFLEIIKDFVLFDAGVKKLPRHHQYFGIKAAQEHIHRREGGIIWHTQGSGKSIVMVLLAKWILENNPNARIAIITDRDELDKQIEGVFSDSETQIHRTSSGKDLIKQLSQAKPRLLCSLVHKFKKRDIENFDQFIEELKSEPKQIFGEVFVFVDECHRTQSGKLHRVMKAMLKNSTFIGFTGTPLLKQDKATSLEVFGKYIHTYKFNEAVQDEVVLDLLYEARDIDQKIFSPDKIDAWFEVKTKGLNDFQKSELKKRWGTMQKVLSSASRINSVVRDIIFDFSVQPRLSSETGNAILVAGSIYEACRYFELFQKTELKNKSAIITSYNPLVKDITTEDTGADTDTEKEFIYKTYIDLLGNQKTERYEDEAKEKFIKEPAKMKLLIVVDKLLTGFDAPSCTYLYIDKKMQDHGLFQAICRVNRLDSDDKPFGYIVDYKGLFDEAETAVAVYTSELDYDQFKKEECEILLQTRIEKAKERLENALEEIEYLCQEVPPPQDSLAYIRYFCGNSENEQDLKATEFRRITLYKFTVALLRAYANIAGDLEEAGYSGHEIERIKNKVDFYISLREEIRLASGETLDLKTYEADMRHLIDNYIQAADARKISAFGDNSLLDLIAKSGIAETINQLHKETKNNQEAVAETIENNVRQKIIKEHLIDPVFFDEISRLLEEVIRERKSKALDYEQYLRRIEALAKRAQAGSNEDTPASIKTAAQKALFNNLGKNEHLALKIHEKILEVKPDGWKGDSIKENRIKSALFEILNSTDEVERLFSIIKQQAEY
jgi:type I restriction enzyme R subunit